MTRSEILQIAKPILFSTDMVRAIQVGRKTVTRRVIKVPPYYPYFYGLHDNSDGVITGTKNRLFAGFYNEGKIFYVDGQKRIDAVYYKSPYRPGDYLYVRETWDNLPVNPDETYCGYDKYYYKADGELRPEGWRGNWHPSIHMSKKAARIFLRVTDVRVEQLQDITDEQAEKEGCCDYTSTALGFCYIWDSTIHKKDLDKYGWDANPYVFVIEFMKIDKSEEI